MTTETRFIVVQPARNALVSAFSLPSDYSIDAVRKAASDQPDLWPSHDDRPNRLDTSAYLDDHSNSFCVFEVPPDLPAYADADATSSSVNEGETFADWRNFKFAGALVRRIEVSATLDDEIIRGVHDGDGQDPDADFDDAIHDLTSRMPGGTDGEIVGVLDAAGRQIGSLTYDHEDRRWTYA